MRKIFVVESHEQVLELWRTQGGPPRSVLHLDFHCDLRGLLINQKAQRAFHIWDRFPNVDEGNFLTHAILEGRVSGIRWVHDEPGGRKDDLKTVKYETDVTALFHRLRIALARQSGVPIDYKVLRAVDWKGLEPGEVLDIDWDFFACQEYSLDSIERRVETFWNHDFQCLPNDTYVCYSPNYSHPTRPRFRQFVNELASRFDALVVDIPPPEKTSKNRSRGAQTSWLYRGARRCYHTVGLGLRKRGIF